MTYDEAMKKLVAMHYTRHVFTDDLEAINIALDAVEKQVQKAVNVYDAHPCPVKLCPACGSTFVEAYGTLMKYCANCGQALKDE